MIVKVGNKIFNSEKEPIMIVLSEDDKKNIAQMIPDATKYCSFPDNMKLNDIKNFMKL